MRSGRGEKMQPLRFRRAPQHGGALGARRRQHQRFRRPHAGEAQGDLSPVEAGGGRQHQPARPGVPLHSPHLPQPGQMQIDGPGPDPAPAGQIRLGTAQLRQQRRTEQDGRPHLFRRLSRKRTGFRRAGEDNILPFPPGCAPRSLQQCKAHRHIRKAGHRPQPHPLRAQHGRRKQRKHAVFCRRDAHRTVQRTAACYHDPVFHKCSPHFAKDTPQYAK